MSERKIKKINIKKKKPKWQQKMYNENDKKERKA